MKEEKLEICESVKVFFINDFATFTIPQVMDFGMGEGVELFGVYISDRDKDSLKMVKEALRFKIPYRGLDKDTKKRMIDQLRKFITKNTNPDDCAVLVVDIGGQADVEHVGEHLGYRALEFLKENTKIVETIILLPSEHTKFENPFDLLEFQELSDVFIVIDYKTLFKALPTKDVSRNLVTPAMMIPYYIQAIKRMKLGKQRTRFFGDGAGKLLKKTDDGVVISLGGNTIEIIKEDGTVMIAERRQKNEN
jgi:hypothetical protein